MRPRRSLAVAGLMITVAVYGGVALIVKADDLGLHMAQAGAAFADPAARPAASCDACRRS